MAAERAFTRFQNLPTSFKVSPARAYELVRLGFVRPIRIGRQLRVPESEVERFRREGVPSATKADRRKAVRRSELDRARLPTE